MVNDIKDVEDRIGWFNISVPKAALPALFGFILVQGVMLAWYASSFHQQYQDHVTNTSERFKSVRMQVSDRYRAAQANSDFGLRDERIQRNALDIGKINNTLAGIDKKLDDRFDKLFEYLHNNTRVNAMR